MVHKPPPRGQSPLPSPSFQLIFSALQQRCIAHRDGWLDFSNITQKALPNGWIQMNGMVLLIGNQAINWLIIAIDGLSTDSLKQQQQFFSFFFFFLFFYILVMKGFWFLKTRELKQLSLFIFDLKQERTPFLFHLRNT